MSYIDDNLEPGERVVCRARVRWAAYGYPLLVVALSLWPAQITALASTELVLTDKRVFGKRGMFKRKQIDLAHAKIETARVKFGPIGAWLDYGTVIITAKDGTRIAFKGIAEPYDIQQQIEQAVEVATLGRKLSDFTTEKF
jgi:hypothetical protein